MAVISLFFRQTDFVSLLLYPASSSRPIMSSMSKPVAAPPGPMALLLLFPALPLAGNPPVAELEDKADGKTAESADVRPDAD